MTRAFDAPRQLIFEALTAPELIKRRMLGPDGWKLLECQVDLRVGGALRFLWRDAEGSDLQMTGCYRELDWTDGESLVTQSLREENDVTTLVTSIRYPSRRVRDFALQSGMANGVASCYDALADLLPSIA
jgi:uncharacterized protein YndB with AHSA1/START domain